MSVIGPRLRDHIHAGTWFDVHGEGEPVVLLHGVGLDHDIWRRQVDALKQHFRVVTYDMLGHGQSANPPGARHLDDFVRQLEHLLLNLEISTTALVGFSMGGLVARAFAQKFPGRVSRLVLMSTVYQRSAEQSAAVASRLEEALQHGPQAIIDAALARWFSPEFGQSYPDEISTVRKRLEDNDPIGFFNAYRVFAMHRDQPIDGTIQCPALVMTGARDSGSTPEMTHALAEAIPGARTRVLEGLRHMLPIEGAGEVNEILLEFLRND